jgi:hypothetical protein
VRQKSCAACWHGVQLDISSDTFPKRIPKSTKNERIAIRLVIKTDMYCLPNHNLANFDAAPYGVYRWAGEVAPRRSTARQRRGGDGTGAVDFRLSGNTQDQRRRREDSTMTHDNEEPSAASAGSIANAVKFFCEQT